MALHVQRSLTAPRVSTGAARPAPRGLTRSGAPRERLARRGVRSAAATQTEIYRWPEWSDTWRFLTDAGLQSVDGDRAEEMVLSGKWQLVDVRPSSLYEKSHAAGAISIPLFDNMDWTNASPMAYLRAAAYLVNGVSPVIPNEAFEGDVAKAKSNGKGFIFYCETGGTMQPSTNFMFGKASRSLKACYRALDLSGDIPVAHLDGGLFGWYRAQKPINGEYDAGNAGRTPDVAAAPELEDELK